MRTGLEEAAWQIAKWLRTSDHVVVFTGAGISTESGVPDFRSPGGVWDRFDPDELSYQNFISSPQSRRKYWELYHSLWQDLQRAKPNRAHQVVAKLETSHHKISAVITQNIDGLHQEAGSRNVLELHGTVWKVGCLECSQTYDWKETFRLLEQGEHPPDCTSCGGLLKPATISFGQSLPEAVLYQAQQYSLKADLFITIGTSLLVHPAAMLPQLAKHSGARLVIINREETPLDEIADLIFRGQAGEVMTSILEEFSQDKLPPGS